AASGRDRQVVLAEVYAVGLGGARDVGTVVHQEESAGRARERTDRQRRGEELARARPRPAELQDARPAPEQRGGERRRIAARVERVDDRVERRETHRRSARRGAAADLDAELGDLLAQGVAVD